MSADQVTARGVFRIGDVLGRAWRIFTGNPLFFLGVPVLICAAIVATFVTSAGVVGMAGSAQLLAWTGFVLGAIVALGLHALGQAVVVTGAFQRFRGEPLRIGATLRRSLARAVALVLLTVLWSLAFGICLVFALVVVPFAVFQAGTGMLLAYALVPIALVPAAMAFVVWVVVVPACVIEGVGPIASMFRSFDLTKGYRWMIFGISMLTGVLLLAGSLIDLLVNPVSEVLAVLVHAVWIVIVLALWNCTIAATYHDLRVAKEGIDPRRVASIFD